MLIQLVHAEQALRIDVFRNCGETLAQARPYRLGPIVFRVVELEVLAARAARLLLDIDSGETIDSKHVTDFDRLSSGLDQERIKSAWREHRQPTDPELFETARTRIAESLRAGPERLHRISYSQDVDAVCPKCKDEAPFRLDSAEAMVAILGYC